ncbi:MAG: rRNA maturation RNase YbeY, partial [Kiritimatiellae bacterium]|nr:rRNA maturation RNase YbeY [Kiritimatiellia bacterium]
MRIELTHQQTLHTLREENVIAFATWIMEKVRKLNPDIDWCELSIVFSDDQIRSLNHHWFGKNTVTDVISFAYTNGEPCGEIIVNLQQAMEEGKLRESPDHELALYIAHGCHHLMGADDDTPERKRAMLKIESDWIREAHSLA